MDPALDKIVELHVLTVRSEKYGDRLSRFPLAYRKAIIAAYMASQIVYREGLEYLQEAPATRDILISEARKLTQPA